MKYLVVDVSGPLVPRQAWEEASLEAAAARIKRSRVDDWTILPWCAKKKRYRGCSAAEDKELRRLGAYGDE